MGYNKSIARLIQQWVAWALALWLIVAPAGIVLGCWLACNEGATSCCQKPTPRFAGGFQFGWLPELQGVPSPNASTERLIQAASAFHPPDSIANS
jgi:heme A synthase